MVPKRAASCHAGPEPKRKRRRMTIAEKVKLLDMLKEGGTYAAVASYFKVNESTVRGIKKKEANIRERAEETFYKWAKRVVTTRNKTIIHMEAALALWIADCQKKNIALDTNIIQAKARSLYEMFATNEPEDNTGNQEEEEEGKNDLEDLQPETSSESQPQKPKFSASKGWFAEFQKRFGLKSVSLHGKAASADTSAAEIYVIENSEEIISEGGDEPEQVFNMDETGLFWKEMPSQTFLFNDKAKATSFTKMMTENLDELLDSNSKPITDANLKDITKSGYKEKEEKTKQEPENFFKETVLPLERLAELCCLGKELKEASQEWDDDTVRSVQFCNKVDKVMNPYKILFEWKDKQCQQLPFTTFFKPRQKETVLAATAAASTSTDAPSKEVEEMSQERSKNGDALDTPETIYIKNEVPECKLEFITIKEEPTDYHQVPEDNLSFNGCPSEASLPSTRVARIQNLSSCNRVSQNAPSKPTFKRKRADVEGLVEKSTSPIPSISAKEGNEYSPYGKVVANELRKMNPVQQAIAKKLINKVMLSGAMGTLKPNFHVAR